MGMMPAHLDHKMSLIAKARLQITLGAGCELGLGVDGLSFLFSYFSYLIDLFVSDYRHAPAKPAAYPGREVYRNMIALMLLCQIQPKTSRLSKYG